MERHEPCVDTAGFARHADEPTGNLPCKRIQCDEIWSFVGAKQKNVPAEREGEFGVGDVWTWTAMGDDMAELARRSPINQLDALKARVMLVVDGQDERVPSIQGVSLHKALLKREVAHVWLEKPGEMHGFYDEGNINELYTKMLEFIDSNIGQGVTGGGAAGH